jgi:deazaflavin-dependent oxidoreductase (nitroreductase family)
VSLKERASSRDEKGHPMTNPPADPAQHRTQTLALQGVANRIVRGLLRVPLVSRGVGKNLLTLYVVGRKSGKRYTVPVAYTRHEDVLLIGTPFGWARNLRTGEPVDIRFRGRRRSADVRVVTEEAGVVADYAVIARANRSFAKFNKISIDEHGEPDPGDLHLAWAAGGRVLRLTLR